MGKSNKEKHRKPYEKPTATQLTPEQAKQKLLDFVKRGGQGAKDSLEIMFPEEAQKHSTRNIETSLRRDATARQHHHAKSETPISGRTRDPIAQNPRPGFRRSHAPLDHDDVTREPSLMPPRCPARF
jgi:hypothetical protein